MTEPAKKDRPLRPRHLGIAGLVTVLLQAGVGVRSEKSTTEAIQAIAARELSAIRVEISDLKVSHERDFVKKGDLKDSLESIDRRIETMAARVETVHGRVARIEGFLERKVTTSELEDVGRKRQEVSHR